MSLFDKPYKPEPLHTCRCCRCGRFIRCPCLRPAKYDECDSGCVELCTCPTCQTKAAR